MPINDTDYNCNITAITNHIGFISCHIKPLVIDSLGGRDTHTNTHIHTQTHTHTYIHPHRNNFKKPGMHRHVASARLV